MTRDRIKDNSGLRVQRRGQDLLVGFLPNLIVFILKIIPNSWASDHRAQIPQAMTGQKLQVQHLHYSAGLS